MSDYKFQKELDELLVFFVNQGVNRTIDIQKIPIKFSNSDLSHMLSVLECMKLIAPVTCDFGDGRPPAQLPNLVRVTPDAIFFSHTTSFVDIAKQQQKEKRRFNFEYFTMGWDTLIAFISLVISVISIFIATK